MRTIRHFPANLGSALALAALVVTQVLAQDVTPDDRPRPAAEPIEESTENLLIRRQQQMTEGFYQAFGRQIAQTLTDSGLSQSDSEAIARRYAEGFTECTTAAIETEAERQSISVDELLERLREATYIGNVTPSDDDPVSAAMQRVSGVMDIISVDANLGACVMGAMARAGISFQTGLDTLPDPRGIEPP